MLLACHTLLSPPIHKSPHTAHTPAMLPSREGHGGSISARISVQEYLIASEKLVQLVARLSNCL